MHRELRVAQLIYARVEPAYSPQRKSGFQTVCHSASLTSSEVSAIEKRVQCFQQQADIVRRQFFRLESGNVVLTHTKLLTEPDTTIIDSSGRTGAFITHCLVMTSAQFAEIDYNPFSIFESYPFQEDPQDMVDHIRETSADNYHVHVRAIVDSGPASDWPITEARKLVALALQGEDLLKKGQSVLIAGDQDSILATLHTVFALLPRSKRIVCSFDTCIDRCSTRPGVYWAVGASTQQSGNYIDVNLAARRVGNVAADLPTSADPYLIWLNSIDSRAIADEHFMTRAATIRDLARAFSARSTLDHEALDQAACREFFELSRSRVTQNLKAAFKAWVDTPLSAPLIDYLYAVVEPGELSSLLEMAARQQIEGHYLSECVVEWIDTKRPTLKESDWKDILEMLERAHALDKIDRLEGYILTLEDTELNALEKSVKKRADLPARSREAIQQRREEIGSKPGLLGFLKRR